MPQKILYPFCIANLFLSELCLEPQAASVILTPVADTTLFETIPNNNMGAVPSMAAGITGTGLGSRALLQFDLASAIPSNAVITSARLSVRVVRTPLGGGENSDFALHRMLQSWVEGDKSSLNNGSVASVGETTWNARMHFDILWSRPGASADTDYSAAVSSSVFVAGLGSYEFGSTSGLVEDVQFWLTNRAENFGWIMMSQSEESDATARRFASREDAPNSPALTVEFEMPPSQPLIQEPGIVGEEFRFTFEAEADCSYAVEIPRRFRRKSLERTDQCSSAGDGRPGPDRRFAHLEQPLLSRGC